MKPGARASRRLALALLLGIPAGSAPAVPAPDLRPEPEFAEYAAGIDRTVSGATVQSAVGPVETPLTLELSDFLLDHPDLSAYLVRLHKIAPYRIEMRGSRRSSADDGEGTRGLVVETARREGRRVYYAEGSHRSALFPTILASAVIVMTIDSRPGACPPRVRSTFTVFVRLRNPFLATIVKALRPFLRKTVVGKFTKAFLVADKVGRLMAADPDGISREIGSYPSISADDSARALKLMSVLKRERAACPAST